MPAKARDCRARVVRAGALAPAIRDATLRMEDPPRLDFAAGQWVSIPFGPKIVRAYTIASTPRDGEQITLCADVAPDGIGSRWFTALSPNDAVTFKGPLGGFVFDRADERRALLIGEEIGIVPIHSIVGDLDEGGFDRPLTLIQWARAPVDLVYRGEFESLARRRASFDYHAIVGAADGDWRGECGALIDAVERLAPTEARVVYVAGGEATIKRVREVMMARGVERKAVKWEKFW
jgi:NAD(P)H-flavin reductase